MKAAIFVLVALCSLGLTWGKGCALYAQWAARNYDKVRGDGFTDLLTEDKLVQLLDDNGDGQISAEEVIPLKKQAGVDLPSQAVAQAGKALVDADGDGEITHAEIIAFLAQADANGDGEVKKAEGVQFWSSVYYRVFEAAGETPAGCQ